MYSKSVKNQNNKLNQIRINNRQKVQLKTYLKNLHSRKLNQKKLMKHLPIKNKLVIMNNLIIKMMNF